MTGARLRRAADRFLFRPAAPHPLALFRLGVTALALVQVWILWPYVLQLYGNFGFVQWALTEAGTESWMPSIGKLCLLLQPYGVSSSACVHGVFAVYAVGLAGLALGWKARFWAVIAWLAHSLTINTGYFSVYGVDTMIQICLFYCVWMPVGAAWSLDQWLLRRPAAPAVGARLALRVLQIHLCLIYLDAGVAKMRSIQWWNGDAIWRVLMQPQFAVVDVSWLPRVPLVAMIVCWSVLLIETGYPILIWPRRTRRLWVVATLGLHLGIGFFMGLWLFALIMIIMTVSAFGFSPAPPEKDAEQAGGEAEEEDALHYESVVPGAREPRARRKGRAGGGNQESGAFVAAVHGPEHGG
jgi:hypothetical protein